MKKTVSVNIKGMNFLIEEDAYELLKSYMDRLSLSLRNEIGSKEIIEDIEFRIAELCSKHLTEKKQVIEIEDIEDIIKTLGEPEEYVERNESFTEDKERENTNSSYQQKPTTSSDKRLYRDLKNAKIAGVCGGISSYFNIDVVIIRAIFVVSFLFFGFGFPLYILLWVILPKASSSIDRLRMQGKPITVESVKEEVESAAERLKFESKSFANKIRKDGDYNQKINSIGRLIKSVVGIGILGIGLLFAILLTFVFVGTNLIPFGSSETYLSLTEIGSLVLQGKDDVLWMWSAILLTGFSIILFLFILGSQLIFNLKNKWTKISLISLFFTGVLGIIISVFIGLKTGREMMFEGECERTVGTITGDTLLIESHFEKLNHSSDFNIKSSGNSGLVSVDGNIIKASEIKFNFIESKDTLFHIYQNFTAHSSSHANALRKAEHIHHTVLIQNNTLHVNTNFSFPKSDKLRDQEVTIIIEIPKDKSININNQVIKLGHTNKEINININGLEDLDELRKLEALDDEDLSIKKGKLHSNGEFVEWN